MSAVFSIITLTSNSAKKIKACMDSLSKQTYKNIEHLVLDSGSTDGTLQIVATYQTYNFNSEIISQNGTGLYNALNQAVYHSKGDWVGILHSDDYYFDLNTLKHVNEFIQANTQSNVVYGGVSFVSKRKEILRNWMPSQYSKFRLYFGWMPPHPGVFIKRNHLLKFLPYREDMRISSDYELLLRLFMDKSTNAVCLKKVITHMQMGGVSTSGINATLSAIWEDFAALVSAKFYFFPAILFKRVFKIKQFIVAKRNNNTL